MVRKRRFTMRFHPAPDDPNTGLVHRMVSDGGTVEIGFRFVGRDLRLQSGFVRDSLTPGEPMIDWSVRRNHKKRTHYFAALLGMLSRRAENDCCFQDIPPVSREIPAWEDKRFNHWLEVTLEGLCRIREAAATTP